MVKRNRIIIFFLVLVLSIGVMVPTLMNVVKGISLGLDLQGGFEILYEVHPVKPGDKIDRTALLSTVSALERRVNVLGVSEPNIQIEGTDRIRVQLAGVTNQAQAREILSTQAKLTFRDYQDNELMDGSELKEGGASQSFDQNNKPSVAIKLKDAGKFKDVTQKILDLAPNNVMVIWLDFQKGKDSYQKEVGKADTKYVSAANVGQVFNQTDVQITGNFTAAEAKNLADLLNAGALPVELKEIYSTSVGAQFGKDALDKTVFAGIVGVLIIYAFMILHYRIPGAVAVITLSLYTYFILVIFHWMHGVLTLPGIAAFVLGIGIAVDANIITAERIREELKLGRSLISAFRIGSRGAFTAIFDAHITTIIAGSVLFIFGTSAVKGFATMLLIGIFMSFLTAVFGSRLLLGLLVESRWFNEKIGYFGVKKEEVLNLGDKADHTEVPTKFDKWDFVKYRKPLLAVSAGLLLVGLIMLFVFKLNLGIDFASGTRIEISSNQPLTEDVLRTDLTTLKITPKDIVLSGTESEKAVVRLVGVLDKDQILHVKDYFQKKYGKDHEPSVSTVSPTVGEELAKNAMFAVLWASLGIIIYVAIRFEFHMAISSIASILYDAFFIIAIFSITRLEVEITFIAAVLTIVGYSINDTIVTFDRIREIMHNKKINTVDDLKNVVNKGLQQTFTRSINTVLTVLITVVAMLILGSEAIRNFSIALFIGLISGVYSSLFIAAQLWLVLKTRQLKSGKFKQPKPEKEKKRRENYNDARV